MQLFGLKNCDTCRKALKILDNVDFVDVRTQGVPADILAQAVAEFGDAVVNTRSTTWRGLSDQQRKIAPLELLRQHPTLMKRPLIEHGGKLFLGWSAKTQTALG